MKTAVKHAISLGAACFFAYAACYVCRNMLSAMMPQLLSEDIFPQKLLGGMGSAFFFTYGFGQFINGLIGNRVNPKYMVGTGLFLAGVLTLLFPHVTSNVGCILLWGGCGFLCSMLWPPITKLVGENTNTKIGKLLLTAMTVASIAGTLVTYMLALLGSLSKSWRAAFAISGIVLCVVSVFWILAITVMEKKGRLKSEVQTHTTVCVKGAMRTFFNTEFIAMTVVTMLNGVVCNAVAFWIPTFLSDFLNIRLELVASISILLPILNISGTFLSVYLLKFTKGNEKAMCAVLFLYSAVLFAILPVIGRHMTFLSVAALFLANAAMISTSNMIFSIYVLRFKHTGMLSGITGFLDFASYLFAAVASSVFTNLLTYGGWNGVMGLWFGVAAAGTLASFIAQKSPSKPMQISTSV